MNPTTNHWPQISRAVEDVRVRTISLGGGVQSAAMCWMAARGDIGPMPDAAIFADTGGESRATYDYLDLLEERMPFPVVRVRRPGPTLEELAVSVARGERDRSGAPLPPWFTLQPDGRTGMMPKQCSGAYKRDTVLVEQRRMLGYTDGRRVPGGRVLVETWLGISKDEMVRVQSARQTYVNMRYPLIEQDLTRQGCITYMLERQIPVPPKSSCVFCPYRTSAQWLALKKSSPEDFEHACRVDEAIRDGGRHHEGEAFVHRQCVPLRDADLTDGSADQMPLPLGADCDGCGL